jgi:hypothetical protein
MKRKSFVLVPMRQLLHYLHREPFIEKELTAAFRKVKSRPSAIRAIFKWPFGVTLLRDNGRVTATNHILHAPLLAY